MKKLAHLICCIASVWMLGTMMSCEPLEEPRVYYTEFVTAHVAPDNSLYFEQVLRNDLGSYMLYPNPSVAGTETSEGVRTILQYYVNEERPDKSKEIEVIDLYSVRHDTIIDAHPDTIAAYPNDPVRINTIFRTGNYINLDMAIEYFNKTHSLDLFSNPLQASSDTIDVILRHSRNDDVLGYWVSAYASFYIPNLAQYRAMRVYANTPNTPLGYFIIGLKD